MEHKEIVDTLMFIRPKAEFQLLGDELIWLDENQSKPTQKEIQDGWVAYQAKVESDKVETESKKQALLNRLGITEDEAKLLLA